MSFFRRSIGRSALIATIIIIAIWSLSIVNWGTDFGIYYAYSYFIDDDYRLYKEAFSHKGPLYYLFIKLLGSVVGWGVWQVYITLIATLLAFYLPLIYILSKRVSSSNLFIVILSISLLLLYKQNTNLSISLFQGGFLLLSFYYVTQSISTIEKSGTKEFVIAVILFICAILVRIDALMYTPVYLMSGVFSSINRQSYLLLMQRVMIGLFAMWIIYLINQIYFGYSLYEYYQHNIEFNRYYKNSSNSSIGVLAYIVRPLHFSILMSTGVIIMFLVVLRMKHNALIKKYISNPIAVILKKHEMQTYITSLFVVLLGIVLWVFSSSDKNYHVLIVAIPLLFFVIYWGEDLNGISNHLMFISMPIILYMLMLILGAAIKTIVDDKDCLTNVYCTGSEASLYKKTIRNVSLKDTAIIVGGRGWVYVFADTKPGQSINNWWIYYKANPFVTQYLLKAHNDLINKPSGYEFWIDNELLNGDIGSKYFKEILSSSRQIEDEGKYTRYEIK